MAQSAAKVISGTGIGSPNDPVSQIIAQTIEKLEAENDVAIPAEVPFSKEISGTAVSKVHNGAL
jgi:hypothetical protein